MKDVTCLAEGITYPADSCLTGLNLNELIVGGTGSGKSFSCAYPRLLHTYGSSVVVPIAKRALLDMFAGMFEERGYEVLTLDFSHPEKSDAGYDPLAYIKNDQDAVHLARNLICSASGSEKVREDDPYWNNSAASVLAAEIILLILMTESPTFADVIELHRSLDVKQSKDLLKTNLDSLFDEAETLFPGNTASQMWKTIRGLSIRTASCVLSIVNASIDKLFTENVLKMMRLERKVELRRIGRKKTALFVLSSPLNKSLGTLSNLLYADLFRGFFEEAEAKPDGKLDVPVHVLCDDFACTGRINGFEDYISIFRAAGISVTLLLQSESQLAATYGAGAATTIINNCDTYVYLGGMDIVTCENISKRMNKPLDKVLALPLETAVVFRRGMPPHIARRYQTLEDPVYRELKEKHSHLEKQNREAERSDL